MWKNAKRGRTNRLHSLKLITRHARGVMKKDMEGRGRVSEREEGKMDHSPMFHHPHGATNPY